MLLTTLILSLVLQQPEAPQKVEAPKELLQAAERGDTAKIGGFSQHIILTGVDDKGRTALHAAGEKGQKAAFAQIIAIANDRARNAAVRLPAEGQPSVGALLDAVRARTALFNAADQTGLTPLMHAAREGWDDLARLLIDGGATTTRVDTNGLSATDYAIKAGHTALAEILRVPAK